MIKLLTEERCVKCGGKLSKPVIYRCKDKDELRLMSEQWCLECGFLHYWRDSSVQ